MKIIVEQLNTNENVTYYIEVSWQHFINSFHNNVKFTFKYRGQVFLILKFLHYSQFTHFESFNQLIKKQSCHHIETSQLVSI